ncbi:MAG: hypothetical protein JXA24_07280 [Proteobacteria bacterium]|nr:hypothetical protein [Pseudomonadota bacterium]
MEKIFEHIAAALRSRRGVAIAALASAVIIAAAAADQLRGPGPKMVTPASAIGPESAAGELASWLLVQARLRLRSGETSEAGCAALLSSFLAGGDGEAASFMIELRRDADARAALESAMAQDALESGDRKRWQRHLKRAESAKRSGEKIWRGCSD